MMRLDKFLSHTGSIPRTEAKRSLKKGLVTVNGAVARDADMQINERADLVTFRGRTLSYARFRYYMLHKPAGVVTAVEDTRDRTVMELMAGVNTKGLSPAGRLDKDTEGLLLLTDDGDLIHRLLSPKNHVDKAYFVRTKKPLNPEDLARLCEGVDIGDDKKTLPARAEQKGTHEMILTIHEGRFHQIKRMLQAVENEVVYLKRLSMGPLTLPDDLPAGSFRPLTQQEIRALRPKSLKEALPQFEAAIFDLDGTLVDSMGMWKEIDIEYLGRFGIPLPERLQAEIEGMSFTETAIYFKERFSIADDVEKIKADWNAMAAYKYRHEIPFKEDAPAFLDYLRGQGIKLGVATSNSRELVEQISRSLHLDDYFSCIMTGCEVERGKPAPDIYLAVASRLGTVPEKCIVFEDILPGILAGKNAGMQVCAVEDAYSADMRKKKEQAADYFIDSYGELL